VLTKPYDRYQHVLTAEPLCDFIEYFLLQRGITLEVQREREREREYTLLLCLIPTPDYYV